MELNFQKSVNGWVAEFTATADFNLHIEGVLEGNVQVYQRGSSQGEYAFVRNANIESTSRKVYDYDFAALVYPKYMQVICVTEPTKAVVTFAE